MQLKHDVQSDKDQDKNSELLEIIHKGGSSFPLKLAMVKPEAIASIKEQRASGLHRPGIPH